MDKTILISGGLGFIGSALVKNLLSNTDYIVVNLDKNTYASSEVTLEEYENHKNYIYEKKDICNREDVANIFHKYQPELVFHLAAESHVDNSIKSPIDFINTNILGTYNMLNSSLDILKVKGYQNFLFHHISTDEVYGDLTSEEPAFTERSHYDPSSPYSATKAASDHLVRSWGRTYKLPFFITNCSNNYGPFQNKEKLIPKTIFRALNHEKIPIYGNGNQIRDWLHVEDHITAIKTVAFSGTQSDTYNIGGGNQITNLKLVSEICNLLDKMKPIKDTNIISSYKDLITFVEDRPGHDFRYAIDSSKIFSKLDWEPRITLEEGLKSSVGWYLKNYQWFSEP